MYLSHVSTTEQLQARLAPFRDGQHVFRGQTEHFATPDGAPSICASFTRHGCIPAVMRKWAHYAEVILRYLRGSQGHLLPIPMVVSQALLQHYGWRSFFVDVSRDPAVAAWFACHTYSETGVNRDLPQADASSIVASHTVARYTVAKAPGSLYVFDRRALHDRDVAIVDLEPYGELANGRTRILAQCASLLGPFSGNGVAAGVSRVGVPKEAFVARITAPARVLADFAAASRYKTQRDLFPDQATDPILARLLSVPWQEVEPGIYRRALELPEHQLPRKRSVRRETFPSKNFWISRLGIPNLAGVLFLRVEELLLYATGPSTTARLELLADLVVRHGTVMIEVDGLLMQPNLGRREYGKGIVLTLVEPGIIEISELMIEHPGTQLSLLAGNRGYRYSAVGSQWTRVPSDLDCPCNDSARHDHHLTMVTHVADMLAEGQFKQTRKYELTQRQIFGGP
jgi:hypothetical protein